MKILILSCNTGEGHNSAAKACYEYFHDHHIECTIADTLALVDPIISEKASDLYIFSTRTKLFKLVYQIGDMVSHSISGIKSPVYSANTLYGEKLLHFIQDGGYDVVICVHLFGAEAMTALKHKGLFSGKTIFILTDYGLHPFVQETDLDYYIIPHEHLVEECVEKGLRRESLYPFGIPVKKAFRKKTDTATARKACKQFIPKEIDSNRFWFLTMSGSMGFGNVDKLLKEIREIKDHPIEWLIICGNNQKMFKQLDKSTGSFENIHIIGFTEQIPLLMNACDVIFSKPGGLSSTEAAVNNIPMIHTDPIPGIETKNALFFHYHNMSYSTSDVKEQIAKAIQLCEDSNYRNKMITAQKNNTSPDTCTLIHQLLQK